MNEWKFPLLVKLFDFAHIRAYNIELYHELCASKIKITFTILAGNVFFKKKKKKCECRPYTHVNKYQNRQKRIEDKKENNVHLGYKKKLN